MHPVRQPKHPYVLKKLKYCKHVREFSVLYEIDRCSRRNQSTQYRGLNFGN